MGHICFSFPFQLVALVLAEYTATSKGYKLVLSATGHLKRCHPDGFPSKEASTIARVLVDRVFSVLGVPELLHSDQGREFENDLV